MRSLHFSLAVLFVACGAQTEKGQDPLTPNDPSLDGGGVAESGNADAGTKPSEAGSPGAITAPDETWTWVPFADAVCGNGQPTGIGVNLTQRGKDVLIYLAGGGACWDAQTCFVTKSAMNLESGYTQQRFNTELFRTSPLTQRDNPVNPFKDINLVFVPYCTGDVHAGNAVQTYDPAKFAVHHKGGENVAAYLKRLVPTFSGAGRVFIAGSSAGGFGVQLNYDRFAQAFPNAQVHLLADSAQLLNPAGTRLSDWVSRWNPHAPTGCNGCTQDFTLVPAFLAGTYPNARFGLLAYEEDYTLRRFFGFTVPEIRTNTLNLLVAKYDGRANARYFLMPGEGHVMLSNPLDVGPGGVPVYEFVLQWVNGSPNWANVKQ